MSVFVHPGRLFEGFENRKRRWLPATAGYLGFSFSTGLASVLSQPPSDLEDAIGKGCLLPAETALIWPVVFGALWLFGMSRMLGGTISFQTAVAAGGTALLAPSLVLILLTAALMLIGLASGVTSDLLSGLARIVRIGTGLWGYGSMVIAAESLNGFSRGRTALFAV